MNKIKTIYGIQFLRGICALLVVWNHSYNWVDDIDRYARLGSRMFKFGFVGVDLFFIISGFIIVLVTQNQKDQQATIFLIKRFFRVVPLAWICLLAYGLFSGFSLTQIFSDKNFIKGLLFIPTKPLDPPSFGYGYLGVLWTLSYEILFYVCFAVAMLINGKYRSMVCSGLILLTMFCLQYSGGVGANIQFSFNTNIQTLVNPGRLGGLAGMLANPMMIYFIIGMLIAEVFIRIPEREHISANYFGMLSIFLGATCLSMIQNSYNRLEVVGPWATLVVVGILAWEKLGTLPKSKLLLHLGSISYSLYLIHLPIHKYFYGRRLAGYEFFYAGFSGFAKMGFFTGFCILFAIVCYQLFERPFIKIGHLLIVKISSSRNGLVKKNGSQNPNIKAPV